MTSKQPGVSIPCGHCAHFDPVLGPAHKITEHGWCFKRSKYLAIDPPNRPAPHNAQRVAPGQLAEPFIVRARAVMETCPFAERSTVDPIETKVAKAKAAAAKTK